MGFFSKLFGGGESKQEPDKILQSGFGGLPGYDAEKGAKSLEDIANNRIKETLDPFSIPDSTPGFNFDSFISNSQFGQPLRNELNNPTFGPQNANEQSLINELISQTQGNSAVRGLDPTFGAIAQTIAPELINLRQNRIGNLQGSFGKELDALLGAREQDMGERGGDISAALLGRDQDIGFGSDKTAQAANIFTSLLGLDKQDTVVGGGAGSSYNDTGVAKAITDGFAASKTSDIRLKTDIRLLGNAPNGLGIYKFKYIWDKVTTHIGFMSDEVRLVSPDAVSVHPAGFDMVDYSKVGI